MMSLNVGLITVLSLCAGGLLGSLLRHRIPDHHIRDDSKDVVKTTSGMIATLVALVIGLLVSSAKSSFDQANDAITQAGAKMILLDRTLSRYGPETRAIRTRMKETIEATVKHLWPSERRDSEGIAVVEKGRGIDEVQDMIEQLDTSGELHREMRSSALQTCNDLMHSRWLTIERAQDGLPMPLLVMLIFWLTVLFISLGLLAPRNATAVICLVVCAVSMAGAIALLVELDDPFSGLLRASPAPLLKAVSVIAR